MVGVAMNARVLLWAAWTALAIVWIALGIRVLDQREKPLCAPADNRVVLKLGQPKGATEVGVVYLDFKAAKAARDGITVWLHQYSQCP